MFSIPVRSEEDPRMNPLFWQVKQTLVQHFGPKLPFKPIADLMRSVRDAHRLSIPREATRKKDIGIAWLCEHWELAKPILASQSQFDEEQHSRECDVLAGPWSKMLEIEKLIRDLVGGKPSMKQLLAAARRMAAAHRLRLSREPRRNQKFLLAWYAEHWGILEHDVVAAFSRNPANRAHIVHPSDEPWLEPFPEVEADWDVFPAASEGGAWSSGIGDFGDFCPSTTPAGDRPFFDPE
jgi:hypothetical protein